MRLTINGAELEALEGMKKILQTRCFSMILASGKTQSFRATARGMPLNQVLVSVLKEHGLSTKLDKKGWVIAWKNMKLKPHVA
jgi:hypothetical protein